MTDLALSARNAPAKKRLFALTLGSVGMVYGDIGTSPLYAFKESVAAAARTGAVQQEVILGITSLIVWSLLIIVTLKYVLLLLRADNNGEGGIFSLMALAHGVMKRNLRAKALITVLGVVGASLFYGDAVITPAISVLSAVEGLELVTDRFDSYVIPIAMLIIAILFVVQRKGTTKVARFFGPIMVVWFLTLAAGGLYHIKDNPIVWQAFNPYHAFYFLSEHGVKSVFALGAVVLAITGAEALYADLGHFGKKPIRLAWMLLVMPALILNYLGQAALVLTHPETANNSFYLLYPDWATVPIIILATMATIIASQAVITGAFSLTHQAIQLSILPRLRVEYTSKEQAGQIYMPQVNWLLLGAVIILIEVFRNSSNLASAYGIAVTGTMVISTFITFVVVRYIWKWPIIVVMLTLVPLSIIDLTFFGANLMKFMEGGYIPIIISILLVILIRTWIHGCSLVHGAAGDTESIENVINALEKTPPKRVDGTAVYFSSSITTAPAALLNNLKHNKVLHQQNILLTLRFANKPYIDNAERVEVKSLSKNFTRVFMTFGYMEPTNIIKGLRLIPNDTMKLDLNHTSFFISRRNIVPSARSGMPLWQDRIFIALANNASDAAEYFHIPRSRVVELGVQVTV